MRRARTPIPRKRFSKGTKTSTPATCAPPISRRTTAAPLIRRRIMGKGTAFWLCRDCPRAFAERRDYEVHAREHAGSKGEGKQSECDICNYTKSPDVIRRHMTFDHAADGSHLSQCDYCDYKYDSCCGVSTHMLHSHPNRQVRKPTCLATPPPTPPKRQPPTAREVLRDEQAAYDALSQVEKDALHLPSRKRKRRPATAARTAGRAPPG